MRICFDTQNIYYLPQYLPIADSLRKRGHQCEFIIYKDKNNISQFSNTLNKLKIDIIWFANESAAYNHYKRTKPDWIFFGNSFPHLDTIHQHSHTAQLGHGIGPKPSYYHKSSTPMTVRFIEGIERLEKIKSLYPNDNFIQVGFSKLDPLFSPESNEPFSLPDKLHTEKKTILYAPTFNPSSIEMFPDDWPTDLAQYNIIIKAHAISLSRSSYKNQRKKLEHWSEFKNVYLANDHEFSLVPFMAVSDILLSEASSTLFEFAALDRPVIVCNFFKLRWNYRGVFKYRFIKRFKKDNVTYNGIGKQVESYADLRSAIPQQLNNSDEFHSQRKRFTLNHVGPTDGNTSKRIADYIEAFSKNTN